MTNSELAKSYLIKASKRIKILYLLKKEQAYSDVIREAQEIVELSTKGMLREIGIEPPKWHDVGPLLVESRAKFPKEVAKQVKKLASISKRLRKEREFAFYGEVDFIPTEEYDLRDAEKAIQGAEFVVKMAKLVIRVSL
jgi:HEPN domain-containing protein